MFAPPSRNNRFFILWTHSQTHMVLTRVGLQFHHTHLPGSSLACDLFEIATLLLSSPNFKGSTHHCVDILHCPGCCETWTLILLLKQTNHRPQFTLIHTALLPVHSCLSARLYPSIPLTLYGHISPSSSSPATNRGPSGCQSSKQYPSLSPVLLFTAPLQPLSLLLFDVISFRC